MHRPTRPHTVALGLMALATATCLTADARANSEVGVDFRHLDKCETVVDDTATVVIPIPAKTSDNGPGNSPEDSAGSDDTLYRVTVTEDGVVIKTPIPGRSFEEALGATTGADPKSVGISCFPAQSGYENLYIVDFDATAWLHDLEWQVKSPRGVFMPIRMNERRIY